MFAMLPLYTPNEKSFVELLEKKKWSRKLIESHTWKFHHVYSHVLRLTQVRNAEYVRLNMAQLDAVLKNSRVLGERVRFSTLVVDYLVKWNFLVRRRHNSDFENDQGLQCHKTEVFVKLTDEARTAGWSAWKPTSATAPAPGTARIIEKNALTGIYRDLEAQLNRVTIDAAAARAFTEHAYATKLTLPDKRREISLGDGKVGYRIETNRYVNAEVRSSWLSWIDAVQAGDFGAVQDEDGTGRFFNRITSSPKLLRQFLCLDGKDMVEADIANCQPLIFCTYLQAHFAANMPTKVRDFITECEEGTFYATIRNLVLTKDEQARLTKHEFKTLFFAKIFYSTQKRDWAWRKKFAARYPEVSEYISTMKAAGYKDLPRALSRKESEIMLDGVAAKLLAAGATFVPLHDAIYAIEEDLPLVQQLIREEFALHGVRVTINQPTSLPAPTTPTPDGAHELDGLAEECKVEFDGLEPAMCYELLEVRARTESTNTARAELSLEAFFAE
jgi:hypothetical protein